MTNKFKPCIDLIGGGVGALDAIDGAALVDGDAAIVITSLGTYHYHLNASSGATENSPFRISPNTNPGTKRWHLVGTSAKIGSLVKLTGNQTLSDVTATPISWDSETYDIGGFWVIGAPTRFTIPIGVTDIIIKGQLRFEVDVVGSRVMDIQKNGSYTFDGRPSETKSASSSRVVQTVSPILEVSSADYFEALGYQASGGDLDVEAHNTTWFSIEATNFA